MPAVSVVTSVYNEQDNIREYLDSLCEQTFGDFELVIVDDGSTDDTVEIVSEYTDRLCIQLIRQPHSGWKQAKARAIEAAAGAILVIFDADEIVEPPCLERLIAPFDDARVGAVGGRLRSAGTGWVVEGADVGRELLHRYRKDAAGQAWVIAAGCMALRRVALEAVGGLTRTDRLVAQDVDISWRLRSHGWRLLSVDEAVVRHRDPTTIRGLMRRQFTFGRKAVHTYQLHSQVWFNWKTWVRFYPVALVLLLPFFPLAALALLGLTLPAALFLLRRSPSRLEAKLYAWAILTLHSVAYSAGFLVELLGRPFLRVSGTSSPLA